ncbi:Wadjet anti-phage system protein JetD domain-containing protein [Leadbettera azotonutricia]|uniref:Wadjet protein JetD C-terminal domain-containing protein n=1 Tax=Leadbettera azotonutricia (strain ATCC BAA-888 / DSM 13862 / ZAS-9) TaxID=545695 RepID=F5YBF2_LEAAZ|nr:Wadjet anti-phage system protein JetD domain-containing protein [Leadbettera azotonutricia]AEF81508.1 hypothetical protein TREAZ_1856 [Leadbettera azotonutricia ZAS-9]
MTTWEDHILNAFIERYPFSVSAKVNSADFPAANHRLRIPAAKIFPGFDNAPPDEKESFLDAVESLETQGFVSLVWARHRKGELLSAIVCLDMEKLYQLRKRLSPKAAAEEAREAAEQIVSPNDTLGAFFAFLANGITALDAAKGINAESVHDLAKLFTAISKPINLTLRALSVSLYNDSKRLEALINSFKTIFARAEKQGISIPEFSFLDRSFPETSIAGKIIINIEDSRPLANENGVILILPLITIQKIRSITGYCSVPAAGKSPSVLMIENKETFFTLAASSHKYTCLLYIGGHPNRAVRALAKVLAKSGFAFFHAGDLDPEGILILQELQDIAGQTVTPVCMDASTFDGYLQHGRKLEPSMLKRISLIKDETRALPGIRELIQRIETSGKGIEQEIIEYKPWTLD